MHRNSIVCCAFTYGCENQVTMLLTNFKYYKAICRPIIAEARVKYKKVVAVLKGSKVVGYLPQNLAPITF